MNSLTLFTFSIGLMLAEGFLNFRPVKRFLDRETTFRDWKNNFGKSYKSQIEDNEAKRKWFINKEIIDLHNKQFDLGLKSYRQELWEHSDLSKEEKDTFLLGAVFPSIIPIPPDTFVTPTTTINDSVDWVQRGLVGPVEAQGLCGSCWAFSAKGVVESILRRKNITIPVSAQHMVDCSKWSCYGCGGGWPIAALEYLAESGFTSQAIYPYSGTDKQCGYNDSMSIGVLNKTFLVWTSGNETMLKDIVGTVGPISIMMRIEDSFYKYSSGIYYEPNCGHETNHAMLLVGYGEDPNNGPYWLIKNSWGESWGENGFVRFARNRNNMCNIAHSAIVSCQSSWLKCSQIILFLIFVLVCNVN